MPARPPLYQTVFDAVQRITATTPDLGQPVATRVATLVTAMAIAETSVLCKVASKVVGLQLTRTTNAEHAERSLRFTLNDKRLTLANCYQPVLADAIDWDEFRRTKQPVILIIDESNRNDTEHLLRCSLALWGDALPLASELWEQNTKLEDGAYWDAMDRLLTAVFAIVPADLTVILLADRAYDIPPFIDRLLERGWHFVIRLKANSDVRYRDPKTGKVGAIKTRVRRQVSKPGQRWHKRLDLFKGAGWRPLWVEGIWEAGHKEPVVVISDLPSKHWNLTAYYDCRFWIEPSFKHDKSGGMNWEASRVLGLHHQGVLVLALAWVTLLALTEGLTEALAILDRRSRSQRRSSTTAHPKRSIYRLGLGQLVGALYADTPLLRLRMTHLSGPNWSDRYKQAGCPP